MHRALSVFAFVGLWIAYSPAVLHPAPTTAATQPEQLSSVWRKRALEAFDRILDERQQKSVGATLVNIDPRWRGWLPSAAVPPPSTEPTDNQSLTNFYYERLKEAEQQFSHEHKDSSNVYNLFSALSNSTSPKPPLNRDIEDVVTLVRRATIGASDPEAIWSGLALGYMQLAEQAVDTGDLKLGEDFSEKMLTVLHEHPRLHDEKRGNSDAPEPERLVLLMNSVGLSNEIASVMKECSDQDRHKLVMVLITIAAREGRFDQVRQVIHDHLNQGDPDAVVCERAMLGKAAQRPGEQLTVYGARAVGGVGFYYLTQGRFDIVETIDATPPNEAMRGLSIMGVAGEADIATEHGHPSEARKALQKGWARFVPDRLNYAQELAAFANAAIKAGDYDLAEKVISERECWLPALLIPPAADLARRLNAQGNFDAARRVLNEAELLAWDDLLDSQNYAWRGIEEILKARIDIRDEKNAKALIHSTLMKIQSGHYDDAHRDHGYEDVIGECLELHHSDWLDETATFITSEAEQAVFDALCAVALENVEKNKQ